LRGGNVGDGKSTRLRRRSVGERGDGEGGNASSTGKQRVRSPAIRIEKRNERL
jgi:hypothetical protein